MATAEIRDRQVLRPAGNIVAKGNPSLKKASKPALPSPRTSPAIASKPSLPANPNSVPLPARHSPQLHPIASPSPSPSPPVDPLPLTTLQQPPELVASDHNHVITTTGLTSSSSTSSSSSSLASSTSSDSCGSPPKKKILAKSSKKLDLKKLQGVRIDDLSEKKANANEMPAHSKPKAAEHSRKQGGSSRIVPTTPEACTSAMSSKACLLPPIELKRCKFITPQTDPLYVAYHDEEWGVPVYDDRMLFELLVLAGFQGELNWSSILHKRELYRTSFRGFDAASVASFTAKDIQCLEADKKLGLSKIKIYGVVENAQRILEVICEFGSLSSYLWGFLNKQPMVNEYRYPKQVPVKTSKAELISKELVKRGFRSVGPTTVYSFMQASGMTNDHLVQCFRHRECMVIGLHPKP